MSVRLTQTRPSVGGYGSGNSRGGWLEDERAGGPANIVLGRTRGDARIERIST